MLICKSCGQDSVKLFDGECFKCSVTIKDSRSIQIDQTTAIGLNWEDPEIDMKASIRQLQSVIDKLIITTGR